MARRKHNPSFMECGGKRSATPLYSLTRDKAVSSPRFVTAVQKLAALVPEPFVAGDEQQQSARYRDQSNSGLGHGKDGAGNDEQVGG